MTPSSLIQLSLQLTTDYVDRHAEVRHTLRGTSNTRTDRVVISAYRMPFGSPVGRKI